MPELATNPLLLQNCN